MRYIIDFKPQTAEKEIDDYVSGLSATKIKTWNLFPNTILVESDTAPGVTDIVDSVVQDDTEQIQPLEFPQELKFNPKHFMLDNPDLAHGDVTFSTTDKKDWWKNYVLANPDFDSDTVTIPRRGKNVSVYIMDSGISADHEEFTDTSIHNIWSVTPDDYSDPNGHGTAIASVIAGKSIGFTNADLKIVKIFRSDRGTYVSEFLDALQEIDSDADLNKISVINCSWSIPKNTLIEQKIQQLIDRNVLVVAAAGNNGVVVENVTPASMPDVMCVGSYNEDLEPSDFSNYLGTSSISYSAAGVNSGRVNNWAPGEEIWTAEKSGGYSYVAGTSISAAIATMILAYKLGQLVDEFGYILPEFSGRKFVIGEWTDPNLNIEEDAIQYKLAPSKHLLLPIVGKTDLLDLSESKFSEANNWLISLPAASTAKPQHHVPSIPETSIRYVLGGERSVLGGLKQFAASFDKIELLEAMPDFCSFTAYGDIVIDHPEIINNAESYYDSYELKFCIYDNNVPNEYTINLRIMPVNTDLSEKIQEDEELRITLLYDCQQETQFCPFGSNPISSCPDQCSGFNECCASPFNKTIESCICSPNA